MLKNISISFKISFFILIGTTLVVFIIFSYTTKDAEDLLLKNVEESAKHLTEAKVNYIEEVFLSAEKIPKNIASMMELTSFSKADLYNYLRAAVDNNEEIFGSCIAFEPYSFFSDSLYYAPYYYKEGDQTHLSNIGNNNYQYFFWDWYQIPKELNRAIWSEPYYDEGGGNIMMATYSIPFYKNEDGQRTFLGIVTADISIEWVKQLVSAIQIYEHGYAFLISHTGTVLYHPHEELILNSTIFSDAEERNDENLRRIGRQMIKGETGFMSTVSVVTNKKSWIYYAPLPSSNYSLGLVIPEDELFADLKKLSRNVIILGLLGFFILLTVITGISRRITRPLRRLTGVAGQIGKGDFDVPLPGITSGDEIGKLTDSFAAMQVALKQYMENLKETTVAKEKIESELRMAREIQLGIIPRTFPPFPERKEFDLYAIIEPAKEVGGDFYDFFFIDENNLCIVIGDVSGKGVPAALFMAVTRTLIKSKTSKNLNPEQVLARVNEDLSIDNTTSMFVTIFLAIFNTQTGELRYSNGGHNVPYLLRGDGNIEPFETSSGIALGIIEDFEFESNKTVLNSGNGFYFYTDGVNEAMNPDHELYKNERLEAFLQHAGNIKSRELVENSFKDIKAFTKGAPQSDDITIVALKYICAKNH